jgi:DNA-binding winged helix-turn-helix (wHTH) protein
VDVHVRRLRAKLGSEYESMIGTVRQVGYKFVVPPSRQLPDSNVDQQAKLTPVRERTAVTS